MQFFKWEHPQNLFPTSFPWLRRRARKSSSMGWFRSCSRSRTISERNSITSDVWPRSKPRRGARSTVNCLGLRCNTNTHTHTHTTRTIRYSVCLNQVLMSPLVHMITDADTDMRISHFNVSDTSKTKMKWFDVNVTEDQGKMRQIQRVQMSPRCDHSEWFLKMYTDKAILVVPPKNAWNNFPGDSFLPSYLINKYWKQQWPIPKWISEFRKQDL